MHAEQMRRVNANLTTSHGVHRLALEQIAVHRPSMVRLK